MGIKKTPSQPPETEIEKGPKAANVQLLIGYYCPDCGQELGEADSYELNDKAGRDQEIPEQEAVECENPDCGSKVFGKKMDVKTV